MRSCPTAIAIAVFILTAAQIRADITLSETPRPGAFPLVADKAAADVRYAVADAKVVGIAANLLASDIQQVTTLKPEAYDDARADRATPATRHAVFIGTLGHSPTLEAIIRDQHIDTSAIAGKWESYLITTVANPRPGLDSALLIIGSDRRGTAYGVFTLSELIGVSPWNWWADVPAVHHNALYISGSAVHGPPSVKYRGIFLNDEDWGLQPWAAKTFEPETKDIGPKTYAKIFELLLRLKANFIWPAMHDCTKAFNIYPQNKLVADDYAIVMGSSHCEQMLRNNVTEWTDAQGRVGQAAAASYNYLTNRQGVLDYWKQRLIDNGKFENVYTLGMRGVHDSDMAGGGTTPVRAQRLNQIIADQRQLIAENINKDVAKVPQIFCPYKEVLTLYQAGAVPPDDVTLVWADDNHGYIRQLCTPAEQKRAGGSGVYYHISYWGAPHDYLWLNSTPPALIWEELSKAYDYNARTLWVVNVGDLKPGEIGIDFAMNFAYDTARYNVENISRFLPDFATRTFGLERAKDIAAILDTYYHLNYQRKPEHLGFNTSQNPTARIQPTEFSTVEIQERLQAYTALVDRTNALYNSLPAAQKDAFYELVVYPIRCSALQNQKILYADLNRRAAAIGLARLASRYADVARSAYNDIQSETTYYNDTLAGGKWKNMMSANPHSQDVFRLPTFAPIPTTPASAPTIIVEGSDKPISTDGPHALPTFNSLTRTRYFIAIFNPGRTSIQWSATASQPWVTLSSTEGTLDYFEQIWVNIDYAKMPPGDATAQITVRSEGAAATVDLTAHHLPDPPADYHGFIEDCGYVSMAAERPTRNVARGGAQWKVIPGLGRQGDSISVFPTSSPSITDPKNLPAAAPELQYDFLTSTPAEKATITLQTIPTHRINPERGLRYAVAVDDESPQIIDLETPENSRTWAANVLRAAAFGTTTHNLPAGRHTLHIYMVDPGVVLDHITIDLGGLPKSYLPPPETRLASN